jgi:hypothetical protein
LFSDGLLLIVYYAEAVEALAFVAEIYMQNSDCEKAM